jgi:hypothetical protein
MTFDTWKDLIAKLPSMTEEELLLAINLEASTYKRKNIISRMHMRYSKLRAIRERKALVAGEMVL